MCDFLKKSITVEAANSSWESSLCWEKHLLIQNLKAFCCCGYDLENVVLTFVHPHEYVLMFLLMDLLVVVFFTKRLDLFLCGTAICVLNTYSYFLRHKLF